MSKILMIRHGESFANAGGRADTPPNDIPLTEKGLEQAQLLADSLTDRPDLIVTSSYIRTQQTAAPTIKKFPDVPVEVWPVFEFTFLDAVKCRNTSARERLPMVKEYFRRRDPAYRDAPSCDSFNDFVDRSLEFINRARSMRDKLVYVFTHSQFMALTMYLATHGDQDRVVLMDTFRDELRQITIRNCEVLELPM